MMMDKETTTNTRPIKSKVASLVLLLAIGVAAIIAYWAIVPVDVLEIKKATVESTDDGRVKILNFDYCKVSDAQGKIEWRIVSRSSEILLPEGQDRQGKTCNANLRAPILIPPHAAPDTYIIRYKVTYKVNPIRTVVEEFETTPFTVQ